MKSKDKPDEVFEAPGISLKRYGKFISFGTNRTPAEHKEAKRRLIGSKPEILKEIRKAADEISALIEKYSSFDLVATLWLKNGLFNPETYREWDAPQRPHFIEYAALLELKNPNYRLTSNLVVEGTDVERVHELIESIFTNTAWYNLAQSASVEKMVPEHLRKAEFFGTLRQIAVGPSSYVEHWMDVLEALFNNLRVRQCVEVLGFSYTDVRALVEAIQESMVAKMAERVQSMSDECGRLKRMLSTYMSSGEHVGSADEKVVLDRLRNMPAKARKSVIDGLMWQWAFVAIGDQLSFTTEDLVASTGVPAARVARYLEEFQVQLGSTPAGFLLPMSQNDLRRRPIVSFENKWICPVPHRLVWAIKPALEEALQKSTCWEEYQQERAGFLVRESVKLFQNLLPGAESGQSLYYPMGNGSEAEIDAIVLFDRYAFLIEAKAGSRKRASKGASIKARLEEVVGDAGRQALRALKYIRSTADPVFEGDNGNVLSIDKARISELIPICVSLDSLDVFTSELGELKEILALKQGIWAVSLTDLRIISEIVSRPSEFCHFLRWRLRIGDRNDVNGDRDETNWLGVYIEKGPEDPAPPDGYDHLVFQSHTEKFDRYFIHKLGLRTSPASKPAQYLPQPMPKLLDGIERSSLPGFTAVVEALLDCTFVERDKIAGALNEFATLLQKGRAKEMAVETEKSFFLFASTDREPSDVTSHRTEAESPTGKRTIVIVVKAPWYVTGWHVGSSRSTKT